MYIDSKSQVQKSTNNTVYTKTYVAIFAIFCEFDIVHSD